LNAILATRKPQAWYTIKKKSAAKF
jgi:hypothetical protein